MSKGILDENWKNESPRKLPNDKDFALTNHMKLKSELPIGVEIINKNNRIAIEMLEEIQCELESAFTTNDIDYKNRLIDNTKVRIDTIIRFM